MGWGPRRPQFHPPQKVKKTIVFSKILITNLKTKHRFISTQYKSSNSTEKQINSWMQRVKRLYWARVRATFKTSSRENCYNNVCPHDSVLKKLYIRGHQTLNIGVLRPNVIFGKYAILGLEMKLSRTLKALSSIDCPSSTEPDLSTFHLTYWIWTTIAAKYI